MSSVFGQTFEFSDEVETEITLLRLICATVDKAAWRLPFLLKICKFKADMGYMSLEMSKETGKVGRESGSGGLRC